MDQPDSQLMMADQRGLRSLNARRGEHALLGWDQSGIEQQEIDRPTSLDERGEGGSNVPWVSPWCRVKAVLFFL